MGRERPGALLARRAEEGMDPNDLLCSRNARPQKDRQGASMLVLCSRNARPEKGLVRRPHVDQHGCPLPREEKQASLDGLIRWMVLVRCAQLRVSHVAPNLKSVGVDRPLIGLSPRGINEGSGILSKRLLRPDPF